MAVAQERRRGKPFRRLFGLLVFLAILWCGAWAAAYWGANWAVDRAEALNSPTSRCTEREVSGFPLTIQLGCENARVEERFLGIAANVSGLSASVPLYYPLRLDAGAVGPLVINAPDQGVSLTAQWRRAVTSTEAWPFGAPGIRRFSADVEGLTVAASGRGVPPIDGLTVEQGSIRVGPGEAPDSLRLAVSGEAMDVSALAGQELPPVALRFSLDAVGFGVMLTASLPDQFRTWLSLGGRVELKEFEVATGGVKVAASGPLTVGPDGFISGRVSLSFVGLEQLPNLPDALRPGTVEQATQMVGVLNAFTREVEVDGERRRQVEATITRGQIIIGVVPLPVTIPSIFEMASTVSGRG